MGHVNLSSHFQITPFADQLLLRAEKMAPTLLPSRWGKLLRRVSCMVWSGSLKAVALWIHAGEEMDILKAQAAATPSMETCTVSGKLADR